MILLIFDLGLECFFVFLFVLRIGFFLSFWESMFFSLSCVICSSLIVCCSDGVIISFCVSLRESFCLRVIEEKLVVVWFLLCFGVELRLLWFGLIFEVYNLNFLLR